MHDLKLDLLPRINDLVELEALLLSPLITESQVGMGFDMANTFVAAKELTAMGKSNVGCCIGGWVHACNGPHRQTSIMMFMFDIASNIPTSQLTELCFPNERVLYDATARQAACAVRILRETRKCNWERAMYEGDINNHFVRDITDPLAPVFP